jgi:hypothetical protein
MSKYLSMLALAAALAAPAVVAGPPVPANKQNEQKDKAQAGADAGKAAREAAQAKALREAAARHEAQANKYKAAADNAWNIQQAEMTRYHSERAAARSLRHQAALLERDAKELLQAQKLRNEANDERLEADRLFKAAHAHALNAKAAENEVAADQKSITDLKAAKMPAAVVVAAEAELHRDQARAKSEHEAASAAASKALALIKEAEAEEARAAALERPGVLPPQVMVVRAPPPPPAVKTAPTVQQAAQKK